jgi:CBS domain containing-hemolysin-like protein
VFTGGEFAIVALDRTRVEALADAGNRRARLVRPLLSRLGLSLAGTQLGITTVSIVLGFVTEPALGFLPVALALTLSTVLQTVLGELVPKNAAVARPERVAFLLVPLMRVYLWVFAVPVKVLNRLANATVRAFGVEPREELGRGRSRSELALLIRSSAEKGALDREAGDLLVRSIRFAGKTAADAVVPRFDLVTIPRDATVEDLAEAVRSTGYSRFPVVDPDLDHIAGVVLARDVLRIAPEQRPSTLVEEIIVEMLGVPETRELDSLLREMRSTGNQIAVVVDEHGGTVGIVTLEDILEELVGEIEDEYDLELEVRAPIVGRADGLIPVDGTSHRDEVAEACGFTLPDGEFDTLAGFLLVLLDRIPQIGDVASWQGWEFEILEMDRHRIAVVGVRRPVDGA